MRHLIKPLKFEFFCVMSQEFVTENWGSRSLTRDPRTLGQRDICNQGMRHDGEPQETTSDSETGLELSPSSTGPLRATTPSWSATVIIQQERTSTSLRLGACLLFNLLVSLPSIKGEIERRRMRKVCVRRMRKACLSPQLKSTGTLAEFGKKGQREKGRSREGEL